MTNDMKLLAELDDIGFIGIPNHVPSAEDMAFFAQRAAEARERYRTAQKQSSPGNRKDAACAV